MLVAFSISFGSVLCCLSIRLLFHCSVLERCTLPTLHHRVIPTSKSVKLLCVGRILPFTSMILPAATGLGRCQGKCLVQSPTLVWGFGHTSVGTFDFKKKSCWRLYFVFFYIMVIISCKLEFCCRSSFWQGFCLSPKCCLLFLWAYLEKNSLVVTLLLV